MYSVCVCVFMYECVCMCVYVCMFWYVEVVSIPFKSDTIINVKSL